ncbi:MAG TPA: amino acid ABC transporter permease [Euzebya sp.]|nr:amino acid ABC transporter permease [Euzebya sp.]
MTQTTEPVSRPTGPEDQPVAPDAPSLDIHSARDLLRGNLFKDPKNSILTLVFGTILVYAVYKTFGFVFLNEKVAQDGTVRSGWEVVRQPLVTYMVGTRFSATGIPFSYLWAGIYAVSLALGLTAGAGARKVRDAPAVPLRTTLGILLPPVLGAAAILSMTQTITPTLLTIAIAVPFVIGRELATRLPMGVVQRTALISGALVLLSFLLITGFEPSNVNQFGGLLLTVTVAFTAIVLCFPIGVVLALTRRSNFPLLRPIAVIYIELIRGVPLITLLFMGEFAIRFFFPPGAAVPGSIPRAIIMCTLFSAAYVAEIVRGGLQSVPTGQVEAGQAVGLSPLTITRKIVLPQALRTSIPALVGQSISLLKDTTLLVIIGLFDVLGVTRAILANTAFVNQNFTPETYAFVGFLFWIICFSMSRASQRLETRLGVGTR